MRISAREIGHEKERKYELFLVYMITFYVLILYVMTVKRLNILLKISADKLEV